MVEIAAQDSRVSDLSLRRVKRVGSISLSTIPNLVTTLLEELRRTYVIGEGATEVRMRQKIDKVI